MTHSSDAATVLDRLPGETLLEYPFWHILDAGNLCSVAARRPKSSLSAASAACRQRLRAQAGLGRASMPVELISIYNNAALLFYHNGRLGRAEEITLDALRLCSSGWKKTDDLAWLACMLQPYVNLGRLGLARDEFGSAIPFFKKIYEYVWKGTAFDLGGYNFTPDLLGGFRDLKNEELKLEPFAASIYLADCGKAYLCRGEFESLLEFTGQLAGELGITGSGASRSAPATGNDVQLTTDQKSAVALVVAELQARAWAGFGDIDKALTIYAGMVRQLPRQRPSMVGLYSWIAELLHKKGRQDQSQRVLEYAGNLLKSFAVKPSLDLEYHGAHWTLALQRSRRGDAEGAQAHAVVALAHANGCDHQVGKLRSQILLALSGFRSDEKPGPHAVFDQRFIQCMEESDSCMYPLERACALLELANGLNDGIGDRDALNRSARKILQALELHDGFVPRELRIELGAAVSEKHSSAFAIFQDPEMEHLYRELRDYAAGNGDDGFRLEVKNAGREARSALSAGSGARNGS